MPSTALFGSSAGRSSSKNLVEFKAGKMTMKGKMVHPDKRKGLLYVYQSDDSLIHFCWKDRGTGTVEDDLIIFPDDCEFKRVEACTTGRVYILKFKSSNKKLFFWLQEPKTDKDEDNCKKVNEMLNNPPAAGSSRSGGGTPEDLHNLLGSMSQQQLMQLFGSFGSGGGSASSLNSLLGTVNRSSSSRTSTASTATTTSETPAKSGGNSGSNGGNNGSNNGATTTGSTAATTATSGAGSGTTSTTGGAIQLSDLQRFLSSMNTAAGPNAPLSPNVDVDLSEAVLSAESIQGVLNNLSLVRDLSPHLPEVNTDQASTERLRATLLSPQFQQAVRRFGAALASGQIGPVVQQFQVGESAVLAASQGNMEEFVKALEKTTLNKEGDVKAGENSSQKEKEEEEEKKEEDAGAGAGAGGKDDEKMQEG